MIRRRPTIWNVLFSFTNYTLWLIILNTILFVVFSIWIYVNPEALGYIELQPASIIAGDRLWTIVTSMFMHQGLFHLLVNMFTLFFLGTMTERIVGRRRFLLLYFAAGIFGALFFVLGAVLGTTFEGGANIFGSIDGYAAGASGALFGLLGILAVLIPTYSVYLIVGPLIVIIGEIIISPFLPAPFDLIFSTLMSILIFVMIFSLFSFSPKLRKIAVPVKLKMWVAPIVAIVPLVLVSFFVALPIGNSAHFGGLVVGLLYGWFLLRAYPKKIVLLRRMMR